MNKTILSLVLAMAFCATYLPAQGRGGGGQRGGSQGGKVPRWARDSPVGQAMGSPSATTTRQQDRDRIRATDQQRDRLRTCNQTADQIHTKPARWRAMPEDHNSTQTRRGNSVIKFVSTSRPCSRNMSN